MAGTENLDLLERNLRQSADNAPMFLRIIGRDSNGRILALLREYHQELTVSGGVYLPNGLSNPKEPDISKFYSLVGQHFVLTPQLVERHMTVWLGQLRPAPRQKLSAAVSNVLEILRTQGANDNILRNAYIKFLCWLRDPFGRILGRLGTLPPPKILFEGSLGKYEVLLLHILHQVGCNVWYVHFTSEEPYLKGDRAGQYSQKVKGDLLSPPEQHFAARSSGTAAVSSARTGSASPVDSVRRGTVPPARTGSASPADSVRRGMVPPARAGSASPADSARRGMVPPARTTSNAVRSAPIPSGTPSWENLEQTITLNQWVGDRPVWDAILLPRSQRGLHTTGELAGLFAVCFGGDGRDSYRNRLFRLKQSLDSSPKKWILIERKLPAPTVEKTAPFRAIDPKVYPSRKLLVRALAEQIAPSGVGQTSTMLAQRAFVQAMDASPETDNARLYNHGVRLACWLRGCLEQIGTVDQNNVPALVWYGSASKSEVSLLWTLSQSGVDVLYFSPETKQRETFQQHSLPHIWMEILWEDSLPMEPFPQREEKIRTGTAAYNASRELDQLLYTDTGLYRDRQFVRTQPVTLKTTYDEVGQLWGEEAQVRPSFRTENGTVYVPNLFSKINGVDKGDLNLYWNSIRTMITEDTYLVTQVPFLSTSSIRLPSSQAWDYFRGGKLNKKALKDSSAYRYHYLPEETQTYILEKIQALMDYGMLINGGADLPAATLSTLLSLDKELLRLLQNFDFTRAVPKLLIIDVTENLFTLEECILLAFLNLSGFDIAVFSPNGYRNLEQYLRPDSYDNLTVGEFLFDVRIPYLSQPAPKKSSGKWFHRLFGG